MTENVLRSMTDRPAPTGEGSPTGSRARSQALLATLVAEYRFSPSGRFPSTALVRLLGEFGVSVSGARVALSRVARRGLLMPTREGRASFYSVNPENLAARDARLRSYLDFGRVNEPWDGAWTVVVFSVPEDHRSLRRRLRLGLGDLKFAPMTDAVWVQTRDLREDVTILSDRLDVRLAVMRATFHELDHESMRPVDAFDLAAVRARYTRFLRHFEPFVKRARSGHIAPAEALIIRATVLAEWREIALHDPDLPAELLPAGWPQSSAQHVFSELWSSTGPLALIRVRDIVAEFEPDAADRLTYYDGRKWRNRARVRERRRRGPGPPPRRERQAAQPRH